MIQATGDFNRLRIVRINIFQKATAKNKYRQIDKMDNDYFKNLFYVTREEAGKQKYTSLLINFKWHILHLE